MKSELYDIREIVDYHTQCCRYCDEGSYEHCMHPECDTYIARIMREEIIALLNKKEAELGEVDYTEGLD